jgi:hypothetical protein
LLEEHMKRTWYGRKCESIPYWEVVHQKSECDSKPVNCRKGLERTESWGRQIADVK